MRMPAQHPLVALAGPTGSGKSELSLCIAQEFRGEIVNYDSVQMYRGFDIGSAKLSLAERQGIPHHLIDVVDACADMTAGQFAREAIAVLTDVTGRGRLPVLAGGTGFYLRALLDGLSPAPVRDTNLRQRLSRRCAAAAGSAGPIFAALRSGFGGAHSSARSAEIDSRGRDSAAIQAADQRRTGPATNSAGRLFRAEDRTVAGPRRIA